MHWLPAPHLIGLYRQLGQIVRPGGVVLNGDHMAFEPSAGRFQQVADAVKARLQDEAFTQRGVEDWTHWWEALAKEPMLQALFIERQRRFTPQRQMDSHRPTLVLHEAALREAGFGQVNVVWQRLDNRVWMAIR